MSSVGNSPQLAGNGLLAHVSESRIEEVIEYSSLHEFVDYTITVREKRSNVRERGYAIDHKKKIEALRCIAAPVKGSAEEVSVLSVSISGLSTS